MHLKRLPLVVFIMVSLWFAPVFAADMGAVNIHGFLSQGYLKTSENNILGKTKKGSYEYNDAGINFSLNATDQLRLGVQLFSRDLGDAGNNKVTLDWAYADYRLSNELGVRLGKIKLPLGMYNTTRDIDALRTWVLLPQCLYDENYRNYYGAVSGGGLYGTLDGKIVGSLDYNLTFGTLENTDQDSTSFRKQVEQLVLPFSYIGQTVSYSALNTRMKIYGGNMTWNTPLEGLRLGGTYQLLMVDYDLPAGGINPGTGLSNPERNLKGICPFWVASLEYRWRDLTFAAEYFENKYKIKLDTPELEAMLDAMGVSMTYQRQGYYGSVAYRFADWFELGSYYGVFYPDKHDKKGESVGFAMTGNNDYQAWQKDLCLTARFDINYSWVCKLEGHHMNGAAMVYDFDSVSDVRKIWSLYAAKVSYTF